MSGFGVHGFIGLRENQTNGGGTGAKRGRKPIVFGVPWSARRPAVGESESGEPLLGPRQRFVARRPYPKKRQSGLTSTSLAITCFEAIATALNQMFESLRRRRLRSTMELVVPPVLTEWCPTPHVTAGRGGHTVQAVVLHTTVGSFSSVCGWFNHPESGVSAHYLVGLEGRVAQFVQEADTAHHAGRVRNATAWVARLADDPNLVTVGIEFEDGGEPHRAERPDIQYLVGGQLLAGVAGRWSLSLDRTHVIGHRELFAGKTCPASLDVDRVLGEAKQWR